MTMRPGWLMGLNLATIGIVTASACDPAKVKVGGSCRSAGDCADDSLCVYDIAQGCAATATCQKAPTGPRCNLVLAYCGCDGTEVGVGCDLPTGSSAVPVFGPKQSATCPTGAPKEVGTFCADTSDCGMGQLCAYPIDGGCAAQGVCQPQLTSACEASRLSLFCGCRREMVGASCATPIGYALEPVSHLKATDETCQPPSPAASAD
jgi:hypothetical protein